MKKIGTIGRQSHFLQLAAIAEVLGVNLPPIGGNHTPELPRKKVEDLSPYSGVPMPTKEALTTAKIAGRKSKKNVQNNV